MIEKSNEILKEVEELNLGMKHEFNMLVSIGIAFSTNTDVVCKNFAQ